MPVHSKLDVDLADDHLRVCECVNLLPDSYSEGEEMFEVSVMSASSGNVVSSTTIKITDNECKKHTFSTNFVWLLLFNSSNSSRSSSSVSIIVYHYYFISVSLIIIAVSPLFSEADSLMTSPYVYLCLQ